MSSPATVPQECVMYEFNLDQYFSQTSARERASLVAKLIKLRDDGQNRNACELYANKIGCARYLFTMSHIIRIKLTITSLCC